MGSAERDARPRRGSRRRAAREGPSLQRTASGTAAAPLARDGVNTLEVLNTVGCHDMDGGRAYRGLRTSGHGPDPARTGLDPSELAL